MISSLHLGLQEQERRSFRGHGGEGIENQTSQENYYTRPAVEAGREPWLPAGDPKRKKLILISALFNDALNDMIPVEKLKFYMERRSDRDCAAGLYARSYAQQRIHLVGRSAEHHAHADENVFDAHGAGIKNDCDGGCLANRLAGNQKIGIEGSCSHF